jgi:hypothetical protein
MHRVPTVLVLAFLAAACDPIVRSTIRVTPAATRSLDVTRLASDSSAPILTPLALDAVERVAGRFGLKSLPPGRCPRAWEGPSFARTFLNICATVLPNGDLRLWVTEGITNHWSARGDSLRRVLEDTLAQFGSVQTVAAP